MASILSVAVARPFKQLVTQTANLEFECKISPDANYFAQPTAVRGNQVLCISNFKVQYSRVYIFIYELAE